MKVKKKPLIGIIDMHTMNLMPPMDYAFKRKVTMSKEKKPVLQVANELIGGQRQKDYGGKLQNFSQTSMLLTGSLAHKLQPGMKITPEDVAIIMMQVKISRLAKSPDHEDSLVDIAGYVGCYEAVQLERKNPKDYPLLGATADYGAKKT